MKKQRGLMQSTALVSFNTMLSRVLGFIRDVIIAQLFGASAGSDAFFVAFKLPNFMRGLFAEGSFSQAFVPVLSEYQTQSSAVEVKQFIDRMAGSLLVFLVPLTALVTLVSPLLIYVVAPGFAHDPYRFGLAAHMLRITFPYLLLISLTALSGAILNTYGNYGIPAFTPVWLNISLIGCGLVLSQYLAVPVYALAWGVLIAGIIQLAFQLPFLVQVGLLPVPRPSFAHPGVKRVLKLMIPALFGVSVSQLNLLLSTVFASLLKVGSVSWLYYADRLMNFPLGVFGVAISTVVLPYLSRNAASDDHSSYRGTLHWGLRMLLVIGVPATVSLIVLSGPLIATLFYYRAFDSHDVLMTQQCLIAYALGVQAFMLVKVLASAFYAKQNIRTPVKIAIIATVTNMAFNALLLVPLQHIGLALASSISAWVNALLLLGLLYKRQIYRFDMQMPKFAGRLVIANVILGGYLYWWAKELTPWLHHGGVWRLTHLLIVVVSAVLLYAVTLLAIGMRKRDLTPSHYRIG